MWKIIIKKTQLNIPLVLHRHIHVKYSKTNSLLIGQFEKLSRLGQMVAQRSKALTRWSYHHSNHIHTHVGHVLCQSLEDASTISHRQCNSGQLRSLGWHTNAHLWICLSCQQADTLHAAYHLQRHCNCTAQTHQCCKHSQAQLLSRRYIWSRRLQNPLGRFAGRWEGLDSM